MTAHPRMDPESGEMYFFGYEADSLATRDVVYCVACTARGCPPTGSSSPAANSVIALALESLELRLQRSDFHLQRQDRLV